MSIFLEAGNIQMAFTGGHFFEVVVMPVVKLLMQMGLEASPVYNYHIVAPWGFFTKVRDQVLS